MSTKFHHTIRRDGDVTWVTLGGVIDEDNELATLGDQLEGSVVVIDVGDVERINSCGVRDWVNWLGGVKGRSRVVLVRCSPAIVAQINLVNNFVGGGVVKSFYIPYFCSECDQEKVMLAEASDLGPPPHQPPVCRCDECDLVMEFDDMADSYFAFLAHQPDVDLSELSSSIDRGDRDAASFGRIRTRAPSVPPPGPSVASLPSIPSLPTSNPAIREFDPAANPSSSALRRMHAERRSTTTLVMALVIAAALVGALLIYALST